MTIKRILFITGTRADFGKLKPLISAVKESDKFEYQIFGTGMHTMAKYGGTIKEIYRCGFDNVYTYMNQVEGEDMEVVLANTVIGLSRYLHENHFDLIVVHGDRVEALAGATVGALRNVRVAHIEGGELSGTVDELMRHAISKLSHLHFVASESARNRLIQLGEQPNTIFTIGSPDVDIMLSSNLPSIEEVKTRYEITFNQYSIAILHPVTTEELQQKEHARIWVDALIAANLNFIVVYPNNDKGANYIFEELKRVSDHKKFKVFPSLRFEYFLTMLKHARFITGNSSAGIHEAPIFGVPTVNIGSRQDNRFSYCSIHNVDFDAELILAAHNKALQNQRYQPTDHYGDGTSAVKFMSALQSDIWHVSSQKSFRDVPNIG